MCDVVEEFIGIRVNKMERSMEDWRRLISTTPKIL
jgi:hypothetical protein